MKITIFSIGIVVLGVLLFGVANPLPADAAIAFSQSVTLKSDWNIISTPRVLESHEFSAPETSANFDIFVLDASKPSGWATMADLGQSEFTPLYAYFVKNKTGVNQTLTLNYQADVPPNERLFQRTFTPTGWYSIGVANPSYAKAQSGSTADTNNIDPILNSLLGEFSYYGTVVDFTDALFTTDPDSVTLSDPWKAVVRSPDVSNTTEINKLNDLRETKGYAIYIKQANSLYSGFQNNDIPPPPQPATIKVSILPTPATQNVVRGVNGFLFAKYDFDAIDSGDHIRVTSIVLRDTLSSATIGDELNTCQLFDGSTVLNTGADAVNPSDPAGLVNDVSFTLNNDLIILKGSKKTVELKCNISSNAEPESTHRWGINSSTPNVVVATVKDSGVQVTPTITSGLGQMMTIKAGGSFTVTLDPSSPAERYVRAGTTDVQMTGFKLHANNEAVSLQEFTLVLSDNASSNEVLKATLWDGATKVGEAVWAGSSKYATSSLSSNFIVPQDGDKLLTIKADLVLLNANTAESRGRQVAINYDGASGIGAKGVGQSSGLKIYSNSPATNAKSAYLVKSTHTLAKISVPSGSLPQTDAILYRFKVTADAAGPAALYKFTFNVSSSSVSATTSNFRLFAYTDSGFSITAYSNNPITTGALQPTLANGKVQVYFNPVNQGSTKEAIVVPAGSTRYFELRGDITNPGSGTGNAISVSLLGDADITSTVNLVNKEVADAVDNSTTGNNDFIWSPMSTSTNVTTHPVTPDWLNGYLVPGLPPTAMSASTLNN